MADRQGRVPSDSPAIPGVATLQGASLPLDERARLIARARRLAWGANAWHLIEFTIAVVSGAAASSTALIGFGVDSLIEALAGFAVIWRFAARRSESAQAERRAQQLVAVSFFALAVYLGVGTLGALVGGVHPRVSWPGLALAAFTAVTMPLLARAKKRLGKRLGSSATVGEGGQNMLCAYLSVALLIGLAANALVGAWWADSLMALGIALVAVREGLRSWQGESCCDSC